MINVQNDVEGLSVIDAFSKIFPHLSTAFCPFLESSHSNHRPHSRVFPCSQKYSQLLVWPLFPPSLIIVAHTRQDIALDCSRTNRTGTATAHNTLILATCEPVSGRISSSSDQNIPWYIRAFGIYIGCSVTPTHRLHRVNSPFRCSFLGISRLLFLFFSYFFSFFFLFPFRCANLPGQVSRPHCSITTGDSAI